MNSPFTILIYLKRQVIRSNPIAWQILHHAQQYLYLLDNVTSLTKEEYHAVCGNVEHSDTLFWNDKGDSL